MNISECHNWGSLKWWYQCEIVNRYKYQLYNTHHMRNCLFYKTTWFCLEYRVFFYNKINNETKKKKRTHSNPVNAYTETIICSLASIENKNERSKKVRHTKIFIKIKYALKCQINIQEEQRTIKINFWAG